MFTCPEAEREKIAERSDEEIQKELKTIYYSSSTFKDHRLKPELIAACYTLGFQRPSRVQEFCLKSFKEDCPSLVVQSQNGTGKTVAFLLPIIQRICPDIHSPQCMIVAPTLELAQQTVKIARDLCQKMPEIEVQEISTMVKPGYKQISAQLVVGSPGKIHRALLHHNIPLSTMRYLVFDEADVMFDIQGNIDIGTKIAIQVSRDVPTLVTCFFSATFNERTDHVIKYLIPDYKCLKIKTPELSINNITQYVALCYDRDAKFRSLLYMCSALPIPSSIVFCNTKASADWIKEKLAEHSRLSDVLHGGQSDEQRFNVVQRFKNSEFKVLISTNLISRGLDIPHVTMVVNYDIPIVHKTGEPDYATYLHRTGRCGRFGKYGICLNLCDSQKDLEFVRKFAEHFQREIIALDFNNTDHLDQLMELYGTHPKK